MAYVESTHTQWAAGQGFFRTGHISAGDVTVRYAYDCGSLGNVSQCRAEIDTLRERSEPVKPLDVVFLSHFHLDHVNCVPDLVRAVGVDRFVIPLVPNAERLLVGAEALSDPGSPQDDWYIDLVVDPAAALRSLGDDIEVIQVEPGSQDVPRAAEKPEDDEEKDNDAGTSWAPPGGDGVAMVVRGTATIPRRPVWIWIPFVLPDVSSRQAEFIAALAAALHTDFDTLVSQLADRAFLRQIVLDSRRELIEAYKAVSTTPTSKRADLNLSSLCLYSGPAVRYTAGSGARSWRSRHGGLDRLEVAAWDVRPGWLGTGDAPLGTPERAKLVIDHYEPFLCNVGTFALPHHGSWASFDSSLLDMFGDPLPTCVVSAGSLNKYGHPDTETVSAVADRGFHLVWVTGDPRSRWTSSATSHM